MTYVTPEPWSVEELTPEELAEIKAVLAAADGLPCCQDSDEAGLGDDDHGIDEA